MASQEREYPSLLFTPLPQQKQNDGHRARSPRSTRSPSTPAYNKTGLYREGSGSRRRSLTPTGSIKDTPPPPPPPPMSYLNADGGEPPKAVQPEPQGYDSLALQGDESTSYGEGEDDRWVTVYGFQPGDQHTVLKEFQKCGSILLFGSGREDRVNWTHLQYSSTFGAQRALLKNGQTVGGKLMVGVKPLESRHRTAAESLASEPHTSLLAPASPVVVRPYKLSGSSSQGGAPQQASSMWAMTKMYILGS